MLDSPQGWRSVGSDMEDRARDPEFMSVFVWVYERFGGGGEVCVR